MRSFCSPYNVVKGFQIVVLSEENPPSSGMYNMDDNNIERVLAM